MLDFLKIKQRVTNKGIVEVYPDFVVGRSEDLMIRGGRFFAVWNQETGLWSTDEYMVAVLVDKELNKYADKLKAEPNVGQISVRYMSNFSSTSWTTFKLFLTKLADQNIPLDSTVAFSNTTLTKKDYVSKRLPYPLEKGDTPAFDRLFGILYDEENLRKILWAIGSIVDGLSKDIHKFYVLFGAPGTGKSTTLNLIEKLFDGYYVSFEAKTLTSGTNAFSNEAFRENPLVGINHEGDLSKVADNSTLNSIVSHDTIMMNVKYQSGYSMRLNTTLFIATNKPVNITDSKSGLIRRLVDIRPTGNKVDPDEYDMLVSQINFELGAIAYKALHVFLEYGKGYYSRYRPLDMMMRTNAFFNFVDEYHYEFTREDYITLSRAWKLYNEYCENSNIPYKMKKYVFRDEFKLYWREFHDRTRIDDMQLRYVYVGFDPSPLSEEEITVSVPQQDMHWLNMTQQKSILDRVRANRPAKHRKYDKWDNVKTTLKDLDTSKLHYYLPEPQEVVIDFDIKDEAGNKSMELNLAAAAKFPKTYAEVSKGGSGIHLHYIYDGDVDKLSRIYDVGVEVLAPIGMFSIRRKLTKCNNEKIATISSGLPLKGDKMVSQSQITSARSLRLVVLKILNREVHDHTKPSIDFLEKVLVEANASGLIYDLEDLKPAIITFASGSTNNATYCMKKALKLPYVSDAEPDESATEADDPRLTFYDVEVFINLLLIRWKYAGSPTTQTMINPSPQQCEGLLRHKLVGYNNRRYDNHILWARVLGYTIEQIKHLSDRIIKEKDNTALFRDAYNISYTDVLDYSSKKQTLKKWEVELGLPHAELDLDWDQPVPEESIPQVVEYCGFDVSATEEVHNHLVGSDFAARQIIAAISGLTVNHSTYSHAARIIFGDDRNPQQKFTYPNLAEMFPGYTFVKGQSSYRGEDPSEGGYVWYKPGLYKDVVYLDITSQHPTSAILLNIFGPYTPRFAELVEARVAIKNGDLKAAEQRLGGVLKPFIRKENADLKGLAYALKIVINIVYGMTSAKFDNAFKDPRNIDNVVAKRGALFMIDLKHALLERGTNVIHFKTDSVKIADHTQKDIDFVVDFGKRYGYDFGIEGIFKKMALITKADLVGKWENGHWEAVGARYSKPYVFKKLFTKEPIVFEDHIEMREVKDASIYIEMEDGSTIFVGKVGNFVPVLPGKGGGKLLRVAGDKRGAVSGTLGYEWMLAEVAREHQEVIDESYFINAVDEAVGLLAELGDINQILD